MRPWVKWMISHKLGYALFAILIIAIPFVALYVILSGIPKFFIELKDWLCNDWIDLWKEIRNITKND